VGGVNLSILRWVVEVRTLTWVLIGFLWALVMWLGVLRNLVVAFLLHVTLEDLDLHLEVLNFRILDPWMALRVGWEWDFQEGHQSPMAECHQPAMA